MKTNEKIAIVLALVIGGIGAIIILENSSWLMMLGIGLLIWGNNIIESLSNK